MDQYLGKRRPADGTLSAAFLLALLIAGAIPPAADAQPRPGAPTILAGREYAGRVERHSDGRAEFVPDAGSIPSSYIVQFVEEPWYVARLAGGFTVSSESAYERRFSEFAADLASTVSGVQHAPMSAPMHDRFFRLFFGVRMDADSLTVEQIRLLPYVRAVFPDEPVAAMLDASVAQVKADLVRAEYGVRGDGVTVAIIDTGVDYLHPALGGGFGDGFRVMGGFDFVNEDDDPMDDNGHGTHVAGIVGADGGGLTGIAPGARFLAYKVLDGDGRGAMSNVIRAIERAVDPNQDGDLSDRADVINLSLGSDRGFPDDPAAVAAGNAMLLGVTVVAAAGNSGNPVPVQGRQGYYAFDGSETVGSPAVSPLVIAVGSVDRSGAMAATSSKGPAARTFAVKPDVVAPGVGIRSAWPGGTDRVLSGTSMAAPHVAGIAALLRSIHPEWTPLEIKAALMNTSVNQGHRVTHQGAGLVDARSAAAAETRVQPTAISFGLMNPDVSVWEAAETIWVRNLSDEPQAYSVTFDAVPPGVVMRAEPNGFVVAAGDSAGVVVTTSVGRGGVPIVAEDIRQYGGYVVILSENGMSRIPWLFVRASRLVIDLSDENGFFTGGGDTHGFVSGMWNRYSKARWMTPTRAEVIALPEGKYYVGAIFQSADGPHRILVNDSVIVSPEGGSIAFNSAQATHGIYFDTVTESGAPLAGLGQLRSGISIEFPNAMGTMAAISSVAHQPAFYVAPSPPTIAYHFTQSAGSFRGGRLYVPQFASQNGIQGDVHFTVDPTRYLKQTVRFDIPEGHAEAKIYAELGGFRRLTGGSLVLSGWATVDAAPVSDGRVESDVFLMAPLAGSAYAALRLHLNYRDLSRDWLNLSSPYLTVIDDSIRTALLGDERITDYRSAPGDTLTFGRAPVTLSYVSNNNISMPSSIHFKNIFRGSAGEERYTDHESGRYRIYDDGGALLKESRLDDFPRSEFPVSAGRYRVEIMTENFSLRNRPGAATHVARFDLTKARPDPPVFFSIQLLDARRRLADAVSRDEAAVLRFAAVSAGFTPELPVASETRAYYRLHGTASWTALPISVLHQDAETVGAVYEADLAPAARTDSSGVDLRMVVADRFGNRSEYILEPAFAVGNWQGHPVSVEPHPPLPATVVLHPNYPNPFNPSTTITFDLPRDTDVQVAIFDLTGRQIAVLADSYFEPGRHVIVWHAGAVASGIYFCRLDAGGTTHTRKLVLAR